MYAAVHGTPDELVSDALKRMNEHGVTQIPVLEDHKSVGSIRESRILTKLLEDRDLLNAQVSELMDEGFPVLDVDASFNDIKLQLQKVYG